MVDCIPITIFIKGMIIRIYIYIYIKCFKNNVVLNVIKFKSHGPPLLMYI